jgi:hypothetical protein
MTARPDGTTPAAAATKYAVDPLFTLPTEPGRGPRRVRVIGDLYHGRIPDGAIYVGRGAPGLPASRYANHHRAGACRTCRAHHDQAGAVAAYSRDLDASPQLIDSARRELAGVDLACWCRLDSRPCHGDVLLIVAAGTAPLDAYAIAVGHRDPR